MTHYTTPGFWRLYNALPTDVQKIADKNYDLLEVDPTRPSLQLKEVAGYWSVRVGLHYRALASRRGDEFVWFWIGSHAEYDKAIS